MSDFDLLVLGGGPAGYVAAIRGAQLGAKVALVEKDTLGGTCLNRGCIPTKAIIACVNIYEKILNSENFGISLSSPFLDFKKVIERKDRIVQKLVKGIEFLIEKNKIELICGVGVTISPNKIEIQSKSGNSQVVTCDKLILATGSLPAKLPGIEFNQTKFLSSDDLLKYHPVPEKLNIVGGGVIGLHFAMIYSSLGSEITIYEALPEILPGIDEEIVKKVKSILSRRKITIYTNFRFDPSQAKDQTLICIGRTPNLEGIESLNLKMKGKSIWVNEKMETSVPNVWAAGDLVSEKMFAHVAFEQGMIAAENALGGDRTFSYEYIPYGIYTSPEIGAVGLTEKEAKEKYKEIKVGRFPYAALGIANAMGDTEGFIKVISNEDGKILGVHILGAEATNLTGVATLALKNGLSIEQLANTFQSHPSFPEGLQEAALAALKRGLHHIV